MPQLLNGKQVATEKELLDFANRVRKAGGADILKELLPSIPGDMSQCLIAKNVNFSSDVYGWEPVDPRIQDSWPNGHSKWVMVPNVLDGQFTKNLAKDLKLRLVRTLAITGCTHGHEGDEAFSYAILLPKIIGNAAAAFDEGHAFTKFDEWEIAKDQARQEHLMQIVDSIEGTLHTEQKQPRDEYGRFVKTD